jgi:hypothetical protein
MRGFILIPADAAFAARSALQERASVARKTARRLADAGVTGPEITWMHERASRDDEAEERIHNAELSRGREPVRKALLSAAEVLDAAVVGECASERVEEALAAVRIALLRLEEGV